VDSWTIEVSVEEFELLYGFQQLTGLILCFLKLVEF